TELSGLTTHYTYDGAGRLTSVTAGDKTVFYEKDDFGRDVKVVTEGRVHRTEYDPTGRVLAEIDEDLNGNVYRKTSFRYDLFGHKTHVITQIDDEQEAVYTTVYNPDHTVASVTDEMGHTTRTTYDRNHINTLGQRVLKTTTTDPLGRVSVTIYDALGRVKLEELYDKTLIFKAKKVFDAAGNVIEEIIFDPKGQRSYTISRTYDENSRLITLTEENEKTTKNAYDCRGRLITKTLPDGTEIYTTYDALDRPIEKKSSDGTLHTHLTYDLNGNVIKTEDVLSNTATYATYDIYNRQLTETLPDDITIAYEYDAMDRITKLTLPDGSAIQYFYDPYYLRVLRRLSGDRSYDITFESYNLRGQVLKRTTPAGSTHFTYDTLGRLTSRTSAHYSITCDAYDAVSNLLQETENDTAKSYTYDAQDNLSSEKGAQANTFTYDALGNCVIENDTPRTHNHLNQLIETADETLSYDTNGRLTQRPNHAYRYDALGRLLGYSSPSDNITFTYAAGPRLLKFTQNNESTSLLYQGDHEIGSLQNGTLTQLKLIDPTHPETTLAIECDNTPYFTQQDSKGNITTLEDIHGTLIESYAYSAFQEIPTTTAPLSPWRFANRRTLSTLSLFTYRLYDPSLRRWLTPDPLDFDDGYNLYAYNKNNPLRYYDPDGRFVVVFALPAIITWGSTGVTVALSSTTLATTAALAAATTAISASLGAFDSNSGTHMQNHFDSGAAGYLSAPVYSGASFEDSQGDTSPSVANPTDTHAPEPESGAFDCLSAFTRGFVDDFTWGATSYLNPYEPRSGVETYMYYAGMGASFVYGLTNGNTEAKLCANAGKYAYKTLCKSANTVRECAGTVATCTKTITKTGKTANTIQKDVNLLSKAGKVPDRAGLTKAGRALDKHGNRAGSPFPKAKGDAITKNTQGQFHLDDILTHPNSTINIRGNGALEFHIPDGRGAYFHGDGTFRGFLSQ
ncbi:MAG: RHS repeat protein, partial [Chlamydiia bacterium]|nr:RHS repeat protein [Chlamydiia bacterium]